MQGLEQALLEQAALCELDCQRHPEGVSKAIIIGELCLAVGEHPELTFEDVLAQGCSSEIGVVNESDAIEVLYMKVHAVSPSLWKNRESPPDGEVTPRSGLGQRESACSA